MLVNYFSRNPQKAKNWNNDRHNAWLDFKFVLLEFLYYARDKQQS